MQTLALIIDNTADGPLAHPHTRAKIARIVAAAPTLDAAFVAIRRHCPTVAVYRGGSHLAIHPVPMHGTDRVAIVLTEHDAAELSAFRPI